MKTTLTLCLCLLGGFGCTQSGSPPLPAERGVPTGASAAKTIGANGGTLSSEDGRLTLTIPPGALSSAVELAIEPITNTAPGGVGGGFRLTPEGTRFAERRTFRGGP